MRVSVWRNVKAQGGYSGFQVTGMIECGQNSKPRKFPRASNKTQHNHWSKKNIRNWMFVFVSSSYHLKLSYASTTANLKIVLMTPKKSLLKSSHPKKSFLKSSRPKKYLTNFPTQKNPGNENFKPQKILRLSLSLDIGAPSHWLLLIQRRQHFKS